jgi:hypothetical protein
MVNFFEKFRPEVLGKGTCTAYDRAEAAGCEFYEAGKDGWCKHTLSPMRNAERGMRNKEKARSGGEGGGRKKEAGEMVTGECFSLEAMKAAEAARMEKKAAETRELMTRAKAKKR